MESRVFPDRKDISGQRLTAKTKGVQQVARESFVTAKVSRR